MALRKLSKIHIVPQKDPTGGRPKWKVVFARIYNSANVDITHHYDDLLFARKIDAVDQVRWTWVPEFECVTLRIHNAKNKIASERTYPKSRDPKKTKG